jgi:sugar lactone lactonase YvrE
VGKSIKRLKAIRQVLMAIAIVVSVCASSRARADIVYWSEYTSGFGAIYSMDVSSGKVSTLVTGTGSGAGGHNIDFPIALALGPDGNIYVGNANNGNIIKVTPAGVASTYVGGLHPNSYGLTFDPSGNLYIAQMGTGTVARVPPNGTEITLVGGLDHPQGGTSDPAGNVYVATAITLTGETVVKVTPSGTTSTFATAVDGILFDAAGNLYTGIPGSVQVTAPGGGTSTIASSIATPIPIGLGSLGDLYVFDGAGANNMLKVMPGGDATTVAHLPNALGLVVSAPEPSMLLVLSLILLTAPRRRSTVRQRQRGLYLRL